MRGTGAETPVGLASAPPYLGRILPAGVAVTKFPPIHYPQHGAD